MADDAVGAGDIVLGSVDQMDQAAGTLDVAEEDETVMETPGGWAP